MCLYLKLSLRNSRRRKRRKRFGLGSRNRLNGVRSAPTHPADLQLDFLDPGERAAISLTLSIGADRLLIDDWYARAEAERRQLHAIGTLGVLADAHLAGLLDFETALGQLRCTNFYISDALIEGLRRPLTRATDKS